MRGAMALSKESVYLQEVIETAVMAVRSLFEAKRAILETEIPADLRCCILRWPRVFAKVVLNLLTNASRFTGRGGIRIQS